MSELLPALSSNTSQEKCLVHVGTLLVNHHSAIALPLLLFYYEFELSVVAGHCGVLTCLVSVLLFDEWYLGNFGGFGLNMRLTQMKRTSYILANW